MSVEEKSLYINEHFYSLQGEGIYSGCAAYFIRLSGCNVHCEWCDSPKSWRMKSGVMMSVAEIVELVKNSGTSIAVVTGGEPMLQDLTLLCSEIKALGVRLHLETSGSEPFTGEFDWITLSPKKNKECRDEYFSMASELKVVVESESDLAWAEGLREKCSANCVALLQSEWNRRNIAYPLIINYIMNNNQWKLSVQTHKYLNIE